MRSLLVVFIGLFLVNDSAEAQLFPRLFARRATAFGYSPATPSARFATASAYGYVPAGAGYTVESYGSAGATNVTYGSSGAGAGYTVESYGSSGATNVAYGSSGGTAGGTAYYRSGGRYGSICPSCGMSHNQRTAKRKVQIVRKERKPVKAVPVSKDKTAKLDITPKNPYCDCIVCDCEVCECGMEKESGLVFIEKNHQSSRLEYVERRAKAPMEVAHNE